MSGPALKFSAKAPLGRHTARHADDDRKLFELAEAKNRAENLIYQLEKTIKEQADKLSEADKAPLDAAIKKVRDAVSSGQTEEIKSATSELEQASTAFSKTLYEKAGAASAGGESAGGESAGSQDDAIDAEFEVKDK